MARSQRIGDALREARRIAVKWRDLMKILELQGPEAAEALGTDALRNPSMANGERHNANAVIALIDIAIEENKP